MDINDYLSQIRKNIDSQLNDIKSKTDSILDSVGGVRNPGLVRLVDESRLEDESKAKIGTFKRLYTDTYSSETGIRYSCSELDYSTLVSLLVSVLEIEINLSLYQELRRLCGVRMPEFANARSESKIVPLGRDYSIDVGKKEQTLGPIRSLAEQKQSELRGIIPDCPGFLKSFSSFIEIRNKADHKEYISKDSFLSFYENYAVFFNRYIGTLMDLKQSFMRPSRSYGSPSFARYSASQSDMDYISALDAQSDKTVEEKHGVIMTDVSRLALKYYGKVNVMSKEHGGVVSLKTLIYNALAKYIDLCAEVGIHYELLDVSAPYWKYAFAQDNSWRAYQKILDDYCDSMGIDGNAPWGLFIIGGNDVIPMPEIANPGHTPEEKEWELYAAEATLDADFLYAYRTERILLDKDGIIAMKFIEDNARFHIGRLPLENGSLESNMEADLLGYFQRAYEAYKPGLSVADGSYKAAGIELDAPLAVSGLRMKETMFSVTEGLPLMHLRSVDELVENNVFVSPGVNLEEENKGTESYLSALKSSDMLIFILHGSNHSTESGFYGDPGDCCAFAPELFEVCDNKVFAGICCWGARFIDYSRKNSSLLTAMYNHTLLYVGASRSAVGGFWRNERCECSETMLKYYVNYLFQGYNAGEALSRAKTNYFRKYFSDDSLYYALMTILEFNLFGDPLLSVCPKLPKNEDFDSCTEVSSGVPMPEGFATRNFEMLYNSASAWQPLLSGLRNMVDANFKFIHSEIASRLYRTFGLEPRELYCAFKTTDYSGKQGYMFKYRHIDGKNTYRTRVETDLSGNISHVFSEY